MSYVYPTEQNNFCGYGSLEQFVRINIERLNKADVDQYKIGAYLLNVNLGIMESEEGGITRSAKLYSYVKEFRVADNGCIEFYSLSIDTVTHVIKMNNTKGNKLPSLEEEINAKEPFLDDENMAQHITRVGTLNDKQNWTYFLIDTYESYEMVGRYQYNDDDSMPDTIINKLSGTYRPKKHVVNEEAPQDNTVVMMPRKPK